MAPREVAPICLCLGKYGPTRTEVDTHGGDGRAYQPHNEENDERDCLSCERGYPAVFSCFDDDVDTDRSVKTLVSDAQI